MSVNMFALCDFGEPDTTAGRQQGKLQENSSRASVHGCMLAAEGRVQLCWQCCCPLMQSVAAVLTAAASTHVVVEVPLCRAAPRPEQRMHAVQQLQRCKQTQPSQMCQQTP